MPLIHHYPRILTFGFVTANCVEEAFSVVDTFIRSGCCCCGQYASSVFMNSFLPTKRCYIFYFKVAAMVPKSELDGKIGDLSAHFYFAHSMKKSVLIEKTKDQGGMLYGNQ